MTPEQELKALVERIDGLITLSTPGPWRMYRHPNAPSPIRWDIVGTTRDDDVAENCLPHTSELITTLRNAWPQLRAALTPAPAVSGQTREEVIEEIAAERKRQVEVEGWTPEHDDEHTYGEMADAAACYALSAADRGPWRNDLIKNRLWPWDREWWKPKRARRDLIRAAALIVAEIERRDRVEQKAEGGV